MTHRCNNGGSQTCMCPYFVDSPCRSTLTRLTAEGTPEKLLNVSDRPTIHSSANPDVETT
jgi:hypothetical protein